MIVRLLAAVISLSLIWPVAHSSAVAQEIWDNPLEQRADDVVMVIQGEMSAESVFDDGFLAEVSAEQFGVISSQLKDQFGEVIRVESVDRQSPTSAKVIFRFERALATASLNIAPNSPHKVSGLLIQTFDPINDSLEKIRTELLELPGEVGVLFAPLETTSTPVFAQNAEKQFAIGSTFKLYVLSALAHSIEAGEKSWSDQVVVNRRSFPSGMMQNWPDDAPVTLQTLATMMISISDNTATDMLLHSVGRSAVEAELRASGHSDPSLTLPFLSTLELFALKGSPDNAAQYIAANMEGKRRILADFEDDVKGNPDEVTPPRFTSPTQIDTLEWFASGRDIQKIMRRIVRLNDPTARNILAVSNALPKARAEEWAYVGYKGGSEPGVLNLSWLLRDKAGAWHVMTLSWNDSNADVTKTTFDIIAQRLITFGS